MPSAGISDLSKRGPSVIAWLHGVQRLYIENALRILICCLLLSLKASISCYDVRTWYLEQLCRSVFWVILIHVWHQNKWSLLSFEMSTVFLHGRFSPALIRTNVDQVISQMSKALEYILVFGGTSKTLLSKWLQFLLEPGKSSEILHLHLPPCAWG